jgi:hypothetical protein
MSARRAHDVPPTQQTLTPITRGWDEIHDGLHPLRRNQGTAVAGVPRLTATAAATLGPTAANALPSGEPVGRRRLRRGRRVLLSQRQLTFEVGNAFLRVGNLFLRLVQCPFTVGQFAAQSLVFSFQPLAIVGALPLFSPEHASHGTPIGSTCTDP